jgi:hypothetical protein
MTKRRTQVKMTVEVDITFDDEWLAEYGVEPKDIDADRVGAWLKAPLKVLGDHLITDLKVLSVKEIGDDDEG